MIRIFWLIALLCGALPGAVLAGDVQDHDDATLVGTWRLSIVFPGFPNEFFSLMVVNTGGTLTDQFADGPRSSTSSGVWKKIRGRSKFAATLEGFVDTDADGIFDLRFQVRETIQLLDEDRFTGTATNENLTVDGTTLLAPPFPGITIQGTRMNVVRE
jgi:hypothetical protein